MIPTVQRVVVVVVVVLLEVARSRCKNEDGTGHNGRICNRHLVDTSVLMELLNGTMRTIWAAGSSSWICTNLERYTVRGELFLTGGRRIVILGSIELGQLSGRAEWCIDL
uniref:Putative secreted protein n=1 Tax=Anopheles darlingi TaxID=43151 RepID=A0A2M4DGB6_ANODA